MRKQKVTGKIEEKRLLNINEVVAYIGVGRVTARKYMDEIGATKHFGSRVVFDKQVIDKAISNM